ncbi:MAG: hypothetical protein J6Z30_08580 [Pyramidobacter sp.]|nr:hypothetical protein [Pyramidobacter sp.]
MSNPIVEMNAIELSRAVHAKKVSCREVMAAYIDHIEKTNPHVNAIVTLVDPDELLKQAGVRDAELAAGTDRGWMHGFPQAVKDLMPTQGIRTTMGSLIFKDFVPEADGVIVSRMERDGAIIIGKTNTPEFGYGSQTYNELFGPTANPYDGQKTSGGSSGGAAAALATRMQAVTDGSDFMGSLRNPAGWCNVCSLRPSIGAIPSGAGDLFSNTMGTCGPMGRRVADIALLFSTMAGYDARFPLSRDPDPRFRELTPENAREKLTADQKGVRVAWLGDWSGYFPVDPEIMTLCRAAVEKMTEFGAVVEDVPAFWNMDEFWDKIWIPIRHYCANSLKPFYDTCRQSLLKPESRWEYEDGLSMSAGDVYRAFEKRTEYLHAMLKVYEKFDYVVTPTAVCFPFDKTIHWPATVNGRAMKTYHNWMQIVTPWTMGGNAVCTMGAGFGAAGLPIGIQIVAAPHKEWELLQFAQAYESVTNFVAKYPPEF